MSIVSRLFSEGFRIFFFAAGLYAVFTGLVWSLFLAGSDAGLIYAPAPVLWHAHEMIFGYASAAVGGFFLTAVPNWTNSKGAGHRFILLVSGIWFAGRLAVWFAGVLPGLLVAAIDLVFVPVLMFNVVLQLLKRPKPQNMMFIIFLTFFWSANLLVHLEWAGVTQETARTGLVSGLIVLSCLIAVLGGRVTPAFTRNAMKRAEVPEQQWPHSHKLVERFSLGLSIAMPLFVFFEMKDDLLGLTAILFGGLQLIRLSNWRALWCADKPILLALHLGLFMLALGMILWGAGLLGLGSEIAGLHVLGIGCVGGMTLAVMSRAALGHSGRELIAPKPMAIGYFVIVSAAILRWLADGTDIPYQFAMLLTGALWIAAFGLYLWSISPVLLGPRLKASTD